MKKTKQIKIKMFMCNKVSTTEEKIKQHVLICQKKKISDSDKCNFENVGTCITFFTFRHLPTNLA